MLISQCEGCKTRLYETARISPQCGKLTGVPVAAREEPIAFGFLAFIAALAISAIYLVLMDWMTP